MRKRAGFYLFVITVVMLGMICGASGQVDPNLMAHWDFETVSGTIVSDSGPYGYDGRLIVGAAVVPEAGYGGVLELDGVGDYMDTVDFSVGEPFTVCMWINPETTDNGQCFIGRHSLGGSNHFLLGFFNDGYQINVGNYQYDSGNPITGWQHLAAVVEKINENLSHVSVYRNGTRLWKVSYATVMDDTDGRPWVVGMDWDGNSATDFFKGQVDDVNIYNRVLTSDEILEHYFAREATQDSPYIISTVEHLEFLSENTELWAAGKYFELANDITLPAVGATETNLSPIGNNTYNFNGNFDGKGNSIVGLTQSGVLDYRGLFGYTGTSAAISNLSVINATVIGDEYIGILVGRNRGIINNCYSIGIVSGNYYLGGLAGMNNQGTINHCYSTGSVTGGDYSFPLGGLVGHNYQGTISNCYSTGSVTGRDYSDYLGGLVGFNFKGTIEKCYSTGSVNGGDDSDNLGGLVGLNKQGKIVHCYSTGKPEGTSNVGGLCGFIDTGGNYEDTGNYWDTITSSITTSTMGTGKTTFQMMRQSTFVGWDFTNTWWDLSFGEYPRLQFQPEHSASGSGTDNDPIIISTVEHLKFLSENTELWAEGIYYELANDITIPSEVTINPIGSEATLFNGDFDGKDNSIIDLIQTGNSDYRGLFGRTGSSAAISNLSVINATVNGDDCLGILVGYNQGTITNCHSTGSVAGGVNSENLGGLVGDNFKGRISNCYSTGSVEAYGDFSWYFGGLVGSNDGTISNCYSTGSVKGFGDDFRYFGGLVGENNGEINHCYSTGSMDCYGLEFWYFGGLVGYNRGTISNCYSTGAVEEYGSWYIGGLVGYNSDTISNCFWDTETSNMTDGVGNNGPDPAGVNGKTTYQMKRQSTFVGWDFVGYGTSDPEDVWRMEVDGVHYPKLYLQYSAGDIVCPEGVGLEDLRCFAEEWLSERINEELHIKSDLNYDDKVDILDFAILAANWLEGTGS